MMEEMQELLESDLATDEIIDKPREKLTETGRPTKSSRSS